MDIRPSFFSRRQFEYSWRKLFFIICCATALLGGACRQKDINPGDLILVRGGAFVNSNSNPYNSNVLMEDFYIGKFEVTQEAWKKIMGTNPSTFKGDDLPVETVSWYECIEYCNKRSLQEGLNPYYNIDKNTIDPNNKSEFDSIKWVVTINKAANGYRLPSELEWEYAASGGQMSKSYVYSGGNNAKDVAWYWQNSGDSILTASWTWSVLEKNHCKTKRVGLKMPNELGLYDMSGNVREWCADWYEDTEIQSGIVRSQRGGGWMGAEYRCRSSNRHSFEASGKGPDQGFRVCRNS